MGDIDPLVLTAGFSPRVVGKEPPQIESRRTRPDARRVRNHLSDDHMDAADGAAMFRHACRLGLEGIVSKRVESRYKSRRCLSWVKVKNPAYERR